VIRRYTREAGVRNLEREIGHLCRKVAVKIAEGESERLSITPELVSELLGKRRFHGMDEIIERTSLPGVAAGLAWTPTGGEVLFIEATAMPGKNDFLLTGSLGKVMQESARAALSYVRSMSDSLGVPQDYWGSHDIHLHIPAGAQPKDGPSAGVTMAAALASLAGGRPIRHDLAMTGEITLRGKVLPVGGIKEKVLAAHRASLKAVLLPRRNEVDLEDVPDEVREEMKFIFVDTVDDILKASLKPKRKPPAAKRKPASADGKASPAKRKVAAKSETKKGTSDKKPARTTKK
jgi:ATP-dependent Lon protease